MHLVEPDLLCVSVDILFDFHIKIKKIHCGTRRRGELGPLVFDGHERGFTGGLDDQIAEYFGKLFLADSHFQGRQVVEFQWGVDVAGSKPRFTSD